MERRSNRGKIVDFDKLMDHYKDEQAIGNMRVNAKGDVLGKNGEIIQSAADRSRAYYKDNPKSSTAKSSLKGPMPDTPQQEQSAMTPDLNTAQSQKTEADQSVMNAVESQPEPVQETKTIVGYKEVEQPNGDIEMVPVYEDDWSENE